MFHIIETQVGASSALFMHPNDYLLLYSTARSHIFNYPAAAVDPTAQFYLYESVNLWAFLS